jgi:hypothetical protein
VGEKRDACRVLVGKLERKKPFARSRSRWEDNIKIAVQRVGWEGVDWHIMAEIRDKWQTGWNRVLSDQVL